MKLSKRDSRHVELDYWELSKSDLLAVTHDGAFHADDVVSAALLKLMFPSVTFKRSRKESDFEKADIVFDVGGGLLDHHGLDKEYRDVDRQHPYASAGLVWRMFGKPFLADYLASSYKLDIGEEGIDYLFEALDNDLIKSVDALDNGVTAYTPIVGNVMDISKLVSLYNVTAFDRSVVSPLYGTVHANDLAFMEVCGIVRGLIVRLLDSTLSTFLDKYEIYDLYTNAKVQGDRYIELPRMMDWSSTLVEFDTDRLIDYVVYPATDQWNVQAVPVALGSFENRKDLPSDWAGLSGSEMARVSGVSDAIFCHTNLFLCVAKSREGALQLLKKALRDT